VRPHAELPEGCGRHLLRELRRAAVPHSAGPPHGNWPGTQREINRIENAHGGEEEHDGLIVGNFQRQKQKLSEVLRKKDQESRLAFAVSAALFLSILLLAAYYFWRRKPQ
jgi:hypothetical protein